MQPALRIHLTLVTTMEKMLALRALKDLGINVESLH